jgi:hypothetical protein
MRWGACAHSAVVASRRNREKRSFFTVVLVIIKSVEHGGNTIEIKPSLRLVEIVNSAANSTYFTCLRQAGGAQPAYGR